MQGRPNRVCRKLGDAHYPEAQVECYFYRGAGVEVRISGELSEGGEEVDLRVVHTNARTGARIMKELEARLTADCRKEIKPDGQA